MILLSRLANRLWTKKIRSQLIIGIVIVHLLLMGIFVFDMTRRQQNFLKTQHHEQSVSMVRGYAQQAGSFILNNDYEALKRLTISQTKYPQLKYALIQLPNAEVLSHTNTKYIGLKTTDSISLSLKNIPSTQTLFEDNNLLDVATPVMEDNKIIAWARVGIGREHIQQNLVGIVRNGIVYMVIALLVGFVVAISVANRLNKGLYSLIRTTDRIKQGERNLRVADFQSYELSRLGIAFNAMLDNISNNERLLEQNEEKLRALVENISDAIILIDRDGRIIYKSPSADRITGYKDEDNNEHPGIGLIHADDIGKAQELFSEAASIPGKALESQLRIKHKDGHIIWIEGTIANLLNKTGVNGFIINYRDITERKKAEATLIEVNHRIGERVKELTGLYALSRLSNDHEKSIEELMQACVDIIPPSYQYPEITCARILLSNWEYSTSNFRESPWKQTAEIRTIGTNETGVLEVYYIEERPEEIEGPFLREERLLINSIADILGTAMERRMAENELKQSEEKFRILVEQSLVGVFIIQDEKFVYVNPGFEKIAGYSSDELIGKANFMDLVKEDDRENVKQNYDARITGTDTGDQYAFRGMRKDGRIIHLETIVSTIQYNNNPAVIGTVVDISHRIEEEKRINKAVNDAQEKERIQIGMELHDNVKQIIAASMLNLDFVRLTLNDHTRVLDILVKVQGYLTESIDELRRISHQLAPSMDDTLTLKDRLKALVDSMNVSRDIKVTVDVEQMNNSINNDVQLAFYRILQEQFANIMKYANATTAKVKISQRKHELMMSITDNGVGFDTALQRKGIGLENIKRRAQVLNGDVKVTSFPGKGCSVEVRVPVG